MKTLEQADKEARKVGTLTVTDAHMRILDMGGHTVEYFGNGGHAPTDHATNFYVSRKGTEVDYASDYFPGSFYKTLTAAIRSIKTRQAVPA
jgi:hypothetical protein